MNYYDIIVIGGGPAGMAAAVAAKKKGKDKILILERGDELGGILNQCIHNGFGLHTFKEELTGPEYASRYIKEVEELEIEYRLSTMVIQITEEKSVTTISEKNGLEKFMAGAIILAMGCRERPRGALNIPGYRPAGIYSAGTVQRLVNIEGLMPGKRIIIVGSGDIGLIMARRMTLEGAKVEAVTELLPFSSGLKRNIVQCLDDFGIPLKLSHTVTRIEGKERVTGAVIAPVDDHGMPDTDKSIHYDCDAILFSCGLIPENELSSECNVEINPSTSGPKVNESMETNVEGIFACGNVLHVHDIVDFVSAEANNAGMAAVTYLNMMEQNYKTEGNIKKSFANGDKNSIEILTGEGIRYTVPNTVNVDKLENELIIRFRVTKQVEDCYINGYLNDKQIVHKRKLIVTPGQMEEIVLTKEQLHDITFGGKFVLKLEEEKK